MRNEENNPGPGVCIRTPELTVMLVINWRMWAGGHAGRGRHVM